MSVAFTISLSDDMFMKLVGVATVMEKRKGEVVRVALGEYFDREEKKFGKGKKAKGDHVDL